ncbi:MAG TPA: beta-ketoacyl synthase N-terminal-like domain-containing protein [Pyrinomonadaceae bacterium]|nr:beta-ketoacyl synthase N-terminal-like domain-containing protein [Pyrinomonadaceae bacterium]
MDVVISAAGVVSGAGSSRAGFKQGLRTARSNRQILPAEPPITTASYEAIKVVDFDPVATLGKKGLQFLPNVTKMLLVAVVEALREAQLDDDRNGDELGVVVGTNFAGLNSIARYDWTVITDGPSFVSPMEAPNTLANAPASHLSIRFTARALNTTIATGRCASLDALGYAGEVLQLGQAKSIVAGAVEEINAYTLWQYADLGLNSETVKPGEGAAVFVLESAGRALNRSVKPLARLAGWSNYLAPRERPVEAISNACQLALRQAGVSVDEISLVGIGVNNDAENDEILSTGVARLFAESASASPKVPAFTTKGLTGETYSVSGGLLVAAVLDAMEDRILPPSTNVIARSWPAPLEFMDHSSAWSPGAALVVESDRLAGASAVVLLPFAS